MTQEEKAKAYDEALKRAKEWREKYSSIISPDGTMAKDFDSIFPQLRESEDERIRKSLIKFLTDIKEISESGRTTWAVRKEDAEMCKSSIAYLEKQKDDKFAPRVLPCSAAWFEDGEEKQKEQKSIPGFENADEGIPGKDFIPVEWVDACDRYGKWKIVRCDEQKPVEWSEEDEKTIWGLTAYIPDEELERLGITRFDILKKLKSLCPQPIQLKEAYKDGFQTSRHAMALAFMNNLDENRPKGKMCLSNGECEDIDKAFKEGDWAKIMRYVEKYSPQSKQEWSEEDDDVLGQIITAFHRIANGCEHYFSQDTARVFEEKLKSICPQPKRNCKDCAMFLNGKCTKPHWRPSEEQMDALDTVLEHEAERVGSSKELEKANALYEQLRRLCKKDEKI